MLILSSSLSAGQRFPLHIRNLEVSPERIHKKLEPNYEAPLGKSRHCTLIFKVNCYADPKPKARIHRYDKGDYDQLRNIVSQYDNDNIENVTCEEAWIYLENVVKEGMSKAIPQSSLSSKKVGRPKCMNSHVLEKVKEKSRRYKKYRSTQDGVDYLAYARIRNQARWECRKANK